MTYSDQFRKQLTYSETKMKIRKQEQMTGPTLILTPLFQRDPHENRVAAHLIMENGVVAISVIIMTNTTVDLDSLAMLLEQNPLPRAHTNKGESSRLLRAINILREAGHVLEYKPF
jgi:hypothetical protein